MTKGNATAANNFTLVSAWAEAAGFRQVWDPVSCKDQYGIENKPDYECSQLNRERLPCIIRKRFLRAFKEFLKGTNTEDALRGHKYLQDIMKQRYNGSEANITMEVERFSKHLDRCEEVFGGGTTSQQMVRDAIAKVR